jgi:urease accessory protein
MKKHIFRLLAGACSLALPGIVFAHPGHDVGNFFSGVSHPVSGWDHLVVMLAIGFWSASVMGKKAWMPVAVFAAFMVAGLSLGVSGIAIANAELGITASIVFMGLLLMTMRQSASQVSIFLIGFFAVFHGYAHGVEMPQMASPWLFATGMLMTTVLLHLAGIGLGLASSSLRMARLNHLLGAMLSGLGLWLLVGNI